MTDAPPAQDKYTLQLAQIRSATTTPTTGNSGGHETPQAADGDATHADDFDLVNFSWEMGGAAGMPQTSTLTLGSDLVTPATNASWVSFSLEDGDFEEHLKDREKGPAMAMARVQLSLCEIRDAVKETREEIRAKWKPDVVLTRSLKEFGLQAVLSPQIHAYRGKKLGHMVVDIMRQLGVSDLPASHNLGRIELCAGIVTRHLTDVHYQIKLKIGQSLYTKDGTFKPTDVGTLFEDCIGTSRVPITLPALIRMSYICSLWKEEFQVQQEADGAAGGVKAKKQKNREDAPLNELRNDKVDFWAHVDQDLQQIRKMCAKPEELAALFLMIHEKDIKQYGDNTIPVVKQNALEDWLTTLHNTAALASKTGE
ncbi:hypothetical protein V5O48_012859, partial [Marasmius crinis-equi]